jgi:transcriptional regulator with XRE-family HTH domain
VDDQAVGLALRRVRLRRNERQQDVSARAGISPARYSAIERGRLDATTLRSLRSAAGALDVRLELVVRWRGGDLDRLLHARHALMSERVGRMLVEAGWEVAPEVSFSHFGERGVIDIVAWHPGDRTLLIVELKTEFADVNELLGSMDRRRRLASVIGRERGWRPDRVGTWVVVAESRTNRRHLARHRTILRTAFPEDGRSIAGWLAAPRRDQSALWFLTDNSPASARRGLAPVKRVGRARPNGKARTAS